MLCIVLCIAFAAVCSNGGKQQNPCCLEVRNNGTGNPNGEYHRRRGMARSVALDTLRGAVGENGTDGKNGLDGKNGIDGKDGTNGKTVLTVKTALTERMVLTEKMVLTVKTVLTAKT